MELMTIIPVKQAPAIAIAVILILIMIMIMDQLGLYWKEDTTIFYG
ncbi:MAG TPA: hypothetical protein VKY40_08755 [Halanaerobiales bacterium]|nr:hypothetical protein [Halanaerobiales bacterium]